MTCFFTPFHEPWLRAYCVQGSAPAADGGTSRLFLSHRYIPSAGQSRGKNNKHRCLLSESATFQEPGGGCLGETSLPHMEEINWGGTWPAKEDAALRAGSCPESETQGRDSDTPPAQLGVSHIHEFHSTQSILFSLKIIRSDSIVTLSNAHGNKYPPAHRALPSASCSTQMLKKCLSGTRRKATVQRLCFLGVTCTWKNTNLCIS